MNSPQSHERNQRSSKTASASRRETISAREVGVTLTISEKALKEIEQIKEERTKAAQQARDVVWR